jgi:hypothetical protein
MIIRLSSVIDVYYCYVKVLLRALQMRFDLNQNQQPSVQTWKTKRHLENILEDYTDLLIWENCNHWLVWRRDNQGIWWDLNSTTLVPTSYTFHKAVNELYNRDVMLFDCTALRCHLHEQVSLLQRKKRKTKK